jgi:cytoskeletal protein CcmA (bactofilin family)
MTRLLLLLTLLLGFSGVMPEAAEAITFRVGDHVEIPAGEVIADDLYVAGRDVRIRGRVDGDLVVMGGQVTVTGAVRDDLIAAGGEVALQGAVGQSVRAAGGTVTVSGDIGRDLLLAGNRLEQLASSQVQGATVVTGRDLALRGATAGKLQANGRDVLIDGLIGSADIHADDLTVTAGARIAGPLTYASAREADIRPGATIAGPVTRTEPEARTWRLPGWVGTIFLFLVGVLAGAGLALIMPGALSAISRELRRNPWLSLAAGAGILLGVPILAVILMITVIGIPLALSLLVFFAFGMYIAWVLAAIALGDLLLLRLPIRSVRVRWVAATVLGVALLLALQAIPWVGGLVAVIALMAGFGSVVMALVARLSRG